MRLRRESGDFVIDFSTTSTASIRKGLSAMDLVGEVILFAGGKAHAVTGVVDNGNGTFELKHGGDSTVTYTSATGVATATES